MSDDKLWEKIQKKTFTGWVNNHLRKKGKHIEDLETGFQDGLNLIALLEVISDEIFPFKYDKRPKMKIQKVGNVGFCLNFIKQKGVNLAGTGAEEIVDGNLKMILGMIWIIILRFQIQDISLEELSAKEALLLWCQRKTAGYPGVDVKNFHMSFQDGGALCALIHKHRPDILDFNALDRSDKIGCLNTAFEAAHKHLDIPKLLDAEDMVNVPKPDERSVMTYVVMYYQVFASSQKAEQAGKRVGKLLDFAEANEKLQSDYNGRAQRLAQWCNQTTESMNERNFDNTLDGVVNQINEFKGYRTGIKPPKYNEKVELEALFNGLQTKLSLNNRPAYVPPAGLAPKDIDGLWSTLEHSENQRNLALRDELRRQKKMRDLLSKFNILAGKLDSWSAERNTILSSTDYGHTISEVTAKLNNLDAFESESAAQSERVTQLKSIGSQLEALGFSDMGYVHGRTSNVDNSFATLSQTSANRRSALNAHLAHLQQIETLLLGFAKRGLEFRVWLEKADDILTDPIVVDSVEAVKEIETAYHSLVAERDAKQSEYSALEGLAAQCQQEGVSENKYSEVSWASIQASWNKVQQLVSSRKNEIDAEFATQERNEQLRHQFADLAVAFNAWAKERSASIEALSGDIQTQLDSLQQINQQIQTGQSQFNGLVAATHALDDAAVTENPHTDFTIEQLKSQWDSLNVLSQKKQQVLEKELLEQSGSGLSAEKLQEFRECFKHFDKDEDSLLSRLELGACLKSLGEDLTFEEGGKLDQILSAIDQDADGKVTFEEFASYMERVSSGSDTPDSIKQAFKTIAGDKDFVTEADLSHVLPAEKVQYCISRMKAFPGVDGGYDYNTFTDQLYGK